MSDVKIAKPDHPIHELITKRWSPYAFDEKPVLNEDLVSLFEAARWGASSYNEQPWRFIVATKDEPEEHNRLLSCLVEVNQEWAKNAPVLALGVVRTRFSRNDKPNSVAFHDLGLATANLVLEATRRNLHVHMMAGIVPERAKEIYDIPEPFTVLTGIAIGYPTQSDEVPEALRKRDLVPRTRKPVGEFVFSRAWGESFSF